MDHLIFAKFLFLFLFIYFINLRNMIIYVILDILTSFYFSGFANYLKWNSYFDWFRARVVLFLYS
jgi:hypothetical protein